MSFRFNFGSGYSGGDSDGDSDDVSTPAATAVQTAAPVRMPKHHTLEDLIHLLPQNISYSTLNVTPSIRIPRRELYDVRMQLMAEDGLEISIDGEEQAEESALEGLGDQDIRTSFYEGGLKSWECSVDLVRHLAEGEGTWSGVGQVLELGCGTSLPSLFLFQSILLYRLRGGRSGEDAPPLHFTLTDYNVEVLRLVTLPNLLLSWAISRTPLSDWDCEADLDVTESLRASFASGIRSLGITIDFISGGWGDDMLRLLSPDGYDLVLASETIYSPATTGLFTDVLLGALKKVGRGLVAAKQIYFGVGGNVVDFVSGVEGREAGWVCKIVREENRVGVGRSIVEVSSNGM